MGTIPSSGSTTPADSAETAADSGTEQSPSPEGAAPQEAAPADVPAGEQPPGADTGDGQATSGDGEPTTSEATAESGTGEPSNSPGPDAAAPAAESPAPDRPAAAAQAPPEIQAPPENQAPPEGEPAQEIDTPTEPAQAPLPEIPDEAEVVPPGGASPEPSDVFAGSAGPAGDGAPAAEAPSLSAAAQTPDDDARIGRHAAAGEPEQPLAVDERDPGWAERRAQELVAAVAAGTRWAEERGKAADAEAVENWFDLAAPDIEAARAQETAAAAAQPTAPRRRATPGARPAPPPPAPTPRRLAGSTVVKAKYSRFGLRVIVLTGLAVAVVAALVATAITLVTRPSTPTASTPSVPAPRLPQLGNAKPVLAGLSASAPAPTSAGVARALTPLLAAPALGSGVSAEVLDVASGTVLLDDGAAQPATPASTAKLLTATAALTTLDPAQTIPTKVVAGATPGEVVLVGGGDVTLSRTAPSAAYPGAATVADLADQVTKALPPGTQITRVVVDTSFFSGPTTAAGWQPDDAPSNYAAPVTAVAVDGARVTPTTDNRSGSPEIDAGRALAAALGARGAQVVDGQAPAGARQLGVVHSAPIARLVEQALSQSDNLLAEALARQVASARHQPVSFEGSAQAVVDAVKGAGLDVTGVRMSDGSGLSRQDLIPPRVLAELIARAAAGKLGAAADLLSGLPVAGYDGTLAERGDADPATAPGAVRAKTGTLLGVSALAGTVVTADGRLLAFSVVASNVPGSVAAAENALDQVAHGLATCGCR